MNTTQTELDRAAKRRRLLDILDRESADAIVLTSATALAWYLDGARVHVSLAADPIVSMRVSRDGDELILTSNERERLLEEELPHGLTVRERLWYEPAPALDGLRESDVENQLRAARSILLPGELARYRALAQDAAAAATNAVFASSPAWTERQLVGHAASELVAVGADPLVLLASSVARGAYPHPLPADAPLGRRAMLVICARRHGMIVNLSRWVTFGPPTSEEQDAEQRILEVEKAALDATRPGRPLREVLDAVARAYPAAGFAEDQWQRHHQGGAAGYAGRDPRVTPEVDDVMSGGQAFTWNPWVPGAKVEDTVLLTGSNTGPRIEPLTMDPRWPVAQFGGRTRPITAER